MKTWDLRKLMEWIMIYYFSKILFSRLSNALFVYVPAILANVTMTA